MKNFCDVTMQIVRTNKDQTFATELQRIWMDDLVRLIAVPDTHFDIENLKGDTYNPEVNPDIPHSRLRLDEVEFEERISREGVFGLVGEFWEPKTETWGHADSCWGFVGQDYLGSGYDVDIANCTIKALKKGSL